MGCCLILPILQTDTQLGVGVGLRGRYFGCACFQHSRREEKVGLMPCIEETLNVVISHRMLSELAECCQSTQSCVRAHGVLSELTECCQSSRSVVLPPEVRVVQAHGVLYLDVAEMIISFFHEITECGQSS